MLSALKIHLDKQNPFPLYLQLADQLRSKIKSGAIQPDEAFPEERAMSVLLSVSRPTLRKALKILVDEKYIYKIRGRGVFVSDKVAKLELKNAEYNARVVGISCAENFEDTHAVQIAEGAITTLRDHHIRALRINYLDGVDEKEHILRNSSVLSGLIMYPMRQNVFKNNFNLVASLGIPFVLVRSHPFFPDLAADYVDSDDYAGIQNAISYFAKNGHARIAFFACDSSDELNTERRAGYMDSMKKLKLKPHFITNPVNTNSNVAKIYATATSVFSASSHPTAILAENDVTAVGVFNALKELRLKMPDDVELIGFGDDIEARWRFPGLDFPISTVAVPHMEIGEKAAFLLIQRLANPKLPFNRIRLPTRLSHKSTTHGVL